MVSLVFEDVVKSCFWNVKYWDMLIIYYFDFVVNDLFV